MKHPLPPSAPITAAMAGADAGVIRAIHARHPAAAHRPVPPARPDPWGLRDQWAPEGALAHLAQQAQPAPWGHRVT